MRQISLKFRHALPLGAIMASLSASCAHVDNHAPSPQVETKRRDRSVQPAAATPVINRPKAEESPFRTISHEDDPSLVVTAQATAPPAPLPLSSAEETTGRVTLPPLPTTGASAQESPEAPGAAYTLAELQSLALANNPTLAIASAEIGKERGLWTQVGLGPNPTLGYLRSDATKSSEAQTNGILVQQTFITANKLELNRATEASGIRDAQWQLESQRLRVLNDVRLRYIELSAAQERIDAVEDLLALAEKNRDAAESLFTAQQVAETDVLQATIALNNFQLALQNARLDYEAAWRRMAVLVGCPNLVPRPVVPFDEDLPTFDFESEWQRLAASSPQIHSVEAQIGIAKAELARQQVQPIPDVTVQLVGEFDNVGDFASLNSLIAIPLPIVDRNQGAIHNAHQELVRACKELERVKLVLRDQLAASLRDYAQARNEVEILSERILPAAMKNVELTAKAYEIGEFDFARVSASQSALQDAQLRLVEAQSKARQFSVAITGLQLTGGLNPASIGTAIQDSGGGQRRAVQAALDQTRNGNLNTFAPGALD
ncbi:MAG: TolC family protein [Planctomycetota bacterium]|nr:TolC family protein [Planctomycetaceae bacterium]MDQ3329375.1 TolC family protein [Planctomycetota bacterium]